jgi:diguanylate cyclase (GGDEF)-like protein/PAS domain S-box-containing protein
MGANDNPTRAGSDGPSAGQAVDFRAAVEHMLNGFALHEMIFDAAGRPCDYRFLAINPAFEALTGLRAADIVGKTVLEVLPNNEPFWVETYGKVVMTGEPCRFEHYSRGLGRRYDVAAYRTLPGRFVTIFEDITARRAAEEALKDSEQRFRGLFETMAQGVTYQDTDGRIILANPAASRILGLTMDELLGRTSRDPRWHALQADGSEFPAEGHPSMVAFRTGKEVRDILMGVFCPREGRFRWIRVHSVPEFRAGETVPFRVFSTFDDITELKVAQDALRERERDLLQAQHIGRLGSWSYDPAGQEFRFSEEMFRILDREPRPRGVSYVECRHFIQADDWSAFDAAMDDSVREGRAFEVELRAVRPGGAPRHIVLRGQPLRGGSGKTARVLGTALDITERKQMEEAIRTLSLVDDLTGLYNRRGFMTLGEQQVKIATRAGREMFLLFADMDNLKITNDVHGHAAGDRLLCETARLLRLTYRDSDIIARIGGDEFVALMVDTTDATPEGLVARLREQIRTRNEVEPAPALDLSLGLARFDPGEPPNLEELMRGADRLMYEEKRRKRAQGRKEC